MNNRDWERMGNDIFRTVQDAVESCNYDRLNQTIANTVSQVVDGVSKGVKNARSAANQRQVPVVFERNMPSKAAPIAMTVIGGVWGIIALVVGLVFLVVSLLTGAIAGTSLGVTLGIDAFVLVVAAIMVKKGTSSLGMIKRFKTYVKTIGHAEFCNISELAVSVRKEKAFVIKDIEKMIKKNWFCQGHFDKQKTCLIVTDQMYHQYLQLEDKKEQMRKEEENRIKEQKKQEAQQKEQIQKSRESLSPEVRKIIEQGDAFVQKIRECNDAIPGEEVSEKMYRMEMLVDRIFDRVEENPESVRDIRKLMDYYLPTTVKLLEAYAQMDAQPIGGENIESAKREIEATLDTLNTAFEKILDSLFQDTAWDVSSDISVLNTMLAQEGLKEDGLKHKM